jgi:hypothetical protein
MARSLSLLMGLAALMATSAPLQAQDAAGWDVAGAWSTTTQRFVHAPPAPIPAGIARYGPFRVLDGRSAALVAATDERSPGQFAAMMRAYPQIKRLEMVDCPGTYEDHSNLRLGRMIRAAGITTYVPRGGSVRSGGVELFLAGIERYIEEGGEFAVHSWSDQDGLEATDYAANDPENRKYLVYYQEMGMNSAIARQFYTMTNSVPHGDARWFGAAEMRHWLGQDTPSRPSLPGSLANVPVLAYLDLSGGLN